MKRGRGGSDRQREGGCFVCTKREGEGGQIDRGREVKGCFVVRRERERGVR
jgi:hypothetical protein